MYCMDKNYEFSNVFQSRKVRKLWSLIAAAGCKVYSRHKALYKWIFMKLCAFILLTKYIETCLLVAGLYSYKPKADKFVPITLTNLF